METPPMVRILPMDSRKEFEGRSVEYMQHNFFLVELPSRKDCKYRYHKSGLKAPPGTIVLFQYDGRLIAGARLNRTEKFDSPEDGGYEGALYFDAGSITIFDPIDHADVFRIWPEFKGFGRAKWSLNPERYARFVEELSGTEMVSAEKTK